MNGTLKLSAIGIISAGIISSSLAGEADIFLAREGTPGAEIILGEMATLTEEFAAGELQDAIQQITGATLPIRQLYEKNTVPETAFPAAIILGTPASSKWVRQANDLLKADFAALADSDGFCIRRQGNLIFIAAPGAKGVLNGVYSFIEENAGIIWYRPEWNGACFSRRSDLKVTRTDYLERPAFQVRSWHVCFIPRHIPTELWMTRNRLNFKLCNSASHYVNLFPLSLRQKGIAASTCGHNLHIFLPSGKYFKEHPEFFAMVDGLRRPEVGDVQICFSNKEMTRVFAQNFLEYIYAHPDLEYPGVTIMDTWTCCDGPECTQPITLPDGSQVMPADEAFRSTQFFIFLNEIARQVAAKYPDKKLVTLAYFFTAPPPKVKVEKNIFILFAPAIRCDKHTMAHEVNAKWKARLEAWRKLTPNIVIYEYFGNGSRFPRPLSDTIASDLKYYRGLGLKGLQSEIVPDMMDYKIGDGVALSTMWDVSAMEFWVISRLMWNPDADVETLRSRFLDSVYGPAAGEMKTFFDLIRKAWYASDAVENFQATPVALAQRYIKDTGHEENCRPALRRALAAAQTAEQKQRVNAVASAFESWMKGLAAHPRTTVKVPGTTRNPGEILDFTDPVWQKAAVIDELDKNCRRGVPAANKTMIRLLHDQTALYLGFDCFDNDAANIKGGSLKEREAFPEGDSLEIFLDGDKKAQGNYYQFAFNTTGIRYDGLGYDNAWNGSWTYTVKVEGDRWRAVVAIPFATIGLDPSKSPELNGLFWRTYHPHDKEKKETSSWGGGMVHSSADFGQIILQ